MISQKEYSGMLIKDVRTAHCVCAYGSVPKGSFYVQYSVLRKIGSNKVIIGMDANAVSPLWCGNTEYADYRGEHLEAFVSQWDLFAVRSYRNLCTYKVGSRDIDLALVDSYLISKRTKTTVIDAIESSDHRALVHVFGGLPVAERVSKPRFNTKYAKWSMFKRCIDDQINMLKLGNVCLSSGRQVEELAEQVFAIIMKAVELSMKRKNTFRNLSLGVQ